jgi:hypothetical protein
MSRSARARALTRSASELAADAGLLRHLPPAAIPLTEVQWEALLADAALGAAMASLGSAVADVERQANAEGSNIARDLRPAAVSFAGLARKVARMLWQLAAFAPADPPRRALPLVGLIDDMSLALDRASAWFGTGLDGPGPELPTYRASADWQMPGVLDPVATAFAIDRSELVDEIGAVSDARLLALYRQRLAKLTATCEEILYSVTQPPLDLFAILEPLLELLNSERPLLAWTSANQTLDLIREATAADQARVEGVFAELRQRAAPRSTSRQRLASARQAATDAPTEAERALAVLSAYRIIVEGQLRPWAWALLRLDGAQGQMPLVAELRDRLAASSKALNRHLAGTFVPALRNADAHEEAFFDHLRGQLAIGDQFVDPSDVRSANAELAAIEVGFELALACACSQVEAVARAYSVRPSDPLTATEALSQAEQRYGHAGLQVWSLRRTRGLVQVRLDEIDPLRSSNPCFLATMQANELVAGVTRWQIGIRGEDAWVIDLPSTVLHLNWPVFQRAALWFPVMPQETFLPCLTWCRLQVELPGVALRAAAWLALNDLQHAIDDAAAEPILDVAAFARRVENVINACGATLAVMPSAEAQPLQIAHKLARDLHSSLAGSGEPWPLDVLVNQVLRERDRLPVPAVMPTIDPRPLTLSEFTADAEDPN